MIMRGHLYSTKTKAKIKKGNKTKRNKIQQSLFLDLLYSSARVNSCVRLGKQNDIGHPGGMGNIKSSPQPLALAAGSFTFKVTSLMLIRLDLLTEWEGQVGRDVRIEHSQCFMTKSKNFYRPFRPNWANNIGFCIVFGTLG